jgi:hypothetical protein
MTRGSLAVIASAALLVPGCARDEEIVSVAGSMAVTPNFHEDVTFLQTHTPVIVLKSADGRGQVAVAPGYQGRVMTSGITGARDPRGAAGSAEGAAGAEAPDAPSFGYINRTVIASGTRQPHMTVFGGEDRFWLGPEGGQYALYFASGAAFDPDQWQVPEPIDWGAWPVTDQGPSHVTFRQPMSLTNYARATFTMTVDRTVRVLERGDVARILGRDPGGVDLVAYESDNRITNSGTAAWRPETGLPSIWILGMLRPGARTTVVVPYRSGPESELGPIVNDAYFGAPPPERLQVGPKAVFFRGDGLARGKIGVARPRATDAAGSYDPDRRVLTIVKFTLPDAPHGYVNSMWARQAEPYQGDVINSYNDGPLTPGPAPAAPTFYELESSSPAAALAPGESLRHVHQTVHIQGDEASLNALAVAVLGVSLDDIVKGLP